MPENQKEPSVETTKEDSTGLSKKYSRRNFLKLGLLAGAGATLVACDSKGILSSEKKTLGKNVKKLNNEFSKIESNYVNEQGYFDYDRFRTNPEFDRYVLEINSFSNKIGNETGINPNALKLFASSIIASNLGNWENIDPTLTKEEVKERIGPMQFQYLEVQETLQEKLKDEYNYTPYEMEGIFNVQIGLKHLAHGCVPNIDMSGENNNVLNLTLAQYYGGNDLVKHIKNNKEVAKGSFLRKSYDLYINALKQMGLDSNIVTGTHSTDTSNIELNMQEVWDRAVTYWPETNLKYAKEYFLAQANEYAKDQYNEILGLSKEQYLALFISIAMAESNGGTNRGPNRISGASGWFQVIPKYHLSEYNDFAREKKKPQYNEEQLLNDMKASIEIGTWALMRYKHNPDYQDIKKLMMMFKGGRRFGENWDDGIWWNRVTYCMTNLLGQDSLRLGYMNYQHPAGSHFKAEDFLTRSDHIGRVNIEE